MQESLDLPAGWVNATLESICEVVSGNPAPQGGKFFDQGRFNFVRVQDMGRLGDSTYINVTAHKVNERATSKLRLFPKGSVLFTKSGASTLNNQRAILGCDSYVVSHIAVAIPHDGILSKWVYFALKQIDFADLAHSSVMPSLPLAKIKPIEVLIPPINEQCRIVAKLEELFSELDNGIDSLKTARAQLKVYRQALLKHAFEGKLTEQWRAENKDKLETAEALQKRIQSERDQRYQQQLADWQVGGRHGSKPKPPKQLPPLTADELEELPELPKGWGWVRVGEVGFVGTGVTPLKSRTDFYRNGKIPWVTSGALNEIFVSEATDYVTDLALKETNLRLFPKHSLLIALYGEGKTRGKCSELLIEATTNQAIAAIVQDGEAARLRRYMKWFFQKNYGDIRLKSSGGVQPNLNLGIIENTVFPMCSIDEADRTVDAIESKISEVDQLDQTLVTALQQSEALRQSILKKAFSGQLVPQDPNDEPASALLARIKAEQAAQTHNKKART